MSISVFKVNKDHTIIINKDAVKLVPELSPLTQDELWYVILVADYVDGPLRKKPVDERERIAKAKLFGNKSKVNLKSSKIKLAIEGYKGLVFDIRRETIDVYKKKIDILQNQLLKTDDIKLMQGLDKSLTFLQDRITNIEHSLSISENESIEIQGKGRKISTLEIWQRNMVEYSKHKNNE